MVKIMARNLRPWQLIAMHGWAGDSRGLATLAGRCRTARLGLGQRERGYGPLTPRAPEWLPGQEGAGRRAVMVHSLGLHLLSAAVAAAGRCGGAAGQLRALCAGRSEWAGVWRTALQGMAARLEAGDAQPMLRDFLTKAAAPESAALLPLGPGARLQRSDQRAAAAPMTCAHGNPQRAYQPDFPPRPGC